MPDPALAAEIAAAEADPALHLGRYILLAEIGRGAMGVVYRGWDPAMSRVVAIKRIQLKAGSGPAEVARFVLEARSAGRLRHPGLIAVYDLVEGDASPFIVMDFVPGTNLEKWLRESRPIGEVVRAVREVAGALDHAHARGVVHRDVKPGNILIGEDGRAVLTDFGLARDVTDDGAKLTNAGETVGSPHYMAPEQVRGSSVDPRADIWALGAILYRACCGKAPFVAETPVETFHLILGQPHIAIRKVNPSVHPSLVAVIDRCLAKDAGARYQKAGELAEELDRVLRGEPTLAEGGAPAAGADPTPVRKQSARVRARRSSTGRIRTAPVRRRSSERIPATNRAALAADGSPAPPGSSIDGEDMPSVAATVSLFAGVGAGVGAVAAIAILAVSGAATEPTASASGASSAAATTPGEVAAAPPRVTIEAPRPGEVLDSHDVAVAGRVVVEGDAALPATLDVAGEPATVHDDGFFAVVVHREDGDHELTIREGPDGPPLARVRCIVSAAAGSIAFTEPAVGALVGARPIVVRGRVLGAGADHVAVTGHAAARAPVGEDGTFELNVPVEALSRLREGDDRLEIEAVMPSGARRSSKILLIVDRTAPEIIIDDRRPTADGVMVTGRVDDLRPAELLVDGTRHELGAGGTFRLRVDPKLRDGAPVQFEAIDAAGNRGFLALVVVGDTTPPAIELTEPADDLVTSEPEVTLRGRVEDHDDAGELGAVLGVVLGDGRPLEIGPDGRFRVEVGLDDGPNEIVVTATDRAGNETRAVVRVTRDRAGPSITLDALPPHLVGRSGRQVTVTGRLSEPAAQVTVGDAQADLDAEGAFSATVALELGANVIAVEAVDRAGNASRAETSVWRFRKRPKKPPRGTWWEPTIEQLYAIDASDGQLKLWIKSRSTGLKFVLIPPGTITMGSPASDEYRAADEVPTEVTITRPFYLCATEVPNAVVRMKDPRRRTLDANGLGLDDDARPAAGMSHAEVVAFCDWLGDADGARGHYRLPTEAEWELAARAGAKTAYPWGDDPAPAIDRENVLDTRTVDELGGTHANLKTGRTPYEGDDGHRASAPVSSYEPSRFGLFDILGNVSEWCADEWIALDGDAVSDRRIPKTGGYSVIRGGSWELGKRYGRIPTRRKGSTTGYPDVGFRPMLRIRR